ncbi:MAG TPA: PLDc N-terminal domain-containing protein [Flavisolibacter sp.]|jgi:hypothetical protein|nr:PLDc N-terminal domain-containing protein [Flavisolibacter sp.]
MKNMLHPLFLFGAASIILFFVGIFLKANASESGYIIMIIATVLGGIHWIWSIIDVLGRGDLKPFQKRFWLIAVIAAPVFGGMIFHIMHQKSGRITT